jgi:phosphoserine phosphatase
MKIYLVRHGQTSWNQNQRLQGLRDIPLNCEGIRQSHRLAEWYQKARLGRIVSSPLVRARRTAQILTKGSTRVTIIDDRLREIDHGPWTGLRLEAIQHSFPNDFETWSFYPEKLRMSGGESLTMVYRRCSEVLLDLITTSCDEDIVVVSHGVVNALLLCSAIGASLNRIRDYSPHNCAVSTITVARRQITAVERELDVVAE